MGWRRTPAQAVVWSDFGTVRGHSVKLSTWYSALVTYLYYYLIISLIAPYLTSLSLEILSRCSLMFSGLHLFRVLLCSGSPLRCL